MHLFGWAFFFGQNWDQLWSVRWVSDKSLVELVQCVGNPCFFMFFFAVVDKLSLFPYLQQKITKKRCHQMRLTWYPMNPYRFVGKTTQKQHKGTIAWWCQMLFMFTPTLGNDPIWPASLFPGIFNQQPAGDGNCKNYAMATLRTLSAFWSRYCSFIWVIWVFLKMVGFPPKSSIRK